VCGDVAAYIRSLLVDYCRTVQRTDTNKDLIYAATQPPY